MIARRPLLLAALLPAHAVLAAEPLPAFTVEARDGRFKPDRLELPAGRRVRIDLINHGPGPLEFENDELHIEKVLSEGARSFIVLPALAPGRYEFCDEFNPVTGVLVLVVR